LALQYARSKTLIKKAIFGSVEKVLEKACFFIISCQPHSADLVVDSGYKRRWFVLKGNLLFYFKDTVGLFNRAFAFIKHDLVAPQDSQAEPLGCIVLERVSVPIFSDCLNGVEYGFKLGASDSHLYFLS